MMRAGRVRAYVVTGGRTRPGHDLLANTRVVATRYDPAHAVDLMPEQQAIYSHTIKMITVGDLVANLPDVPETTLKVLLSDLITLDLIHIADNDTTTDQDMLGRILDGLKELSP